MTRYPYNRCDCCIVRNWRPSRGHYRGSGALHRIGQGNAPSLHDCCTWYRTVFWNMCGSFCSWGLRPNRHRSRHTFGLGGFWMWFRWASTQGRSTAQWLFGRDNGLVWCGRAGKSPWRCLWVDAIACSRFCGCHGFGSRFCRKCHDIDIIARCINLSNAWGNQQQSTTIWPYSTLDVWAQVRGSQNSDTALGSYWTDI